MSADGQIIGTYLHGLFEEPAALQVILKWSGHTTELQHDHKTVREAALDRLADVLEQHLDLDELGLKQYPDPVQEQVISD
jgi:adenosylcobyric acid synthase